MRERPLLLFVFSVVVICGACTAPPPSKSRFLASFSAADVIKRSYDQADAQKQPTVSGGESSSVSGSRRINHRDDSADLVISKSDEPLFLSSIKREIEEQLQKSGCRMFPGGSGDNHYAIEYGDGSVNGWIDILGMRGAGDGYRLIIIITEK